MESSFQDNHLTNSGEYGRRSSSSPPLNIFEMHSEMLNALADLANARHQLDADDSTDSAKSIVLDALGRVRLARQQCDEIMYNIRDVQPTTQEEYDVKRKMLYIYHAHLNPDQMTQHFPSENLSGE